MFFVYMLASRSYGTLYVGVTNDLARRMDEHKARKGIAFTARYKVDRLVWFTSFDRVEEAISFEKRLKRWRRDWKIAMIERENPNWLDLHSTLNM